MGTNMGNLLQRSQEREVMAFSPTSRFAFIAPGDADSPEMFEERSARGDGPPLHRHPWATWELVVSGAIRAVVDGEELRLEAGDSLYTPPGAAHAYVVESAEAHIIGMGLSGGRFHRLQAQASPLLLAEGGPDMPAIGALAATCDVELLGPPLDV
jgi:quercetin dioxygenase-like cupin family protein